MNDLPPGWARSSVGDVLANGFFSDGDWVETKDQDPQGSIRLLQLADIGEGHFRDRSSRYINEDAAERLSVNFVEPGDVLVARMPDPIGRACLAPKLGQRAITVVDVCILRSDPGIEPRWLMWALNSPSIRQAIAARATGTTRKRISRKNLATIELAVPPPPEQRRIVHAIEEHFSRLDAAEASLSAARRRAEQLVGAAVTAAMEEWPLAEIGALAEVFVGTTPSRKDPSLWGGAVNWVSSGEVAFNRISETRETIAPGAVKSSRIHPPGTVLIAMIGEGKTRGQVAVLDVPAANNQNSAALRPDESQVTSDWLYEALASQYEASRRLGSGNNQPALNKSRVQRMLIPLPPVEVQSSVAAGIRALRQSADDALQPLSTANKRAAALRRSLLATAFSGKLVPQDPTHEPAAASLERIAAERAAAKPSRKEEAS